MAELPDDHPVAIGARFVALRCNRVRLRLAGGAVVAETEDHVRELMSQCWRLLEAIDEDRDSVEAATIAVQLDEGDIDRLATLTPHAELPDAVPTYLAILLVGAHPLAASAMLRHAGELAAEMAGSQGHVIVLGAGGTELADHKLD